MRIKVLSFAGAAVLAVAAISFLVWVFRGAVARNEGRFDRDCRASAIATRIDGVKRVFRSPEGRISVLGIDPSDPSALTQHRLGGCAVKIIVDVPVGGASWVDVVPITGRPCWCDTATIHVSSLREIE
jgi:hypothetical protein